MTGWSSADFNMLSDDIINNIDTKSPPYISRQKMKSLCRHLTKLFRSGQYKIKINEQFNLDIISRPEHMG